MSEQRTYSKKEISKILNKASEIQTQKDLYGDKQGLSEEELLEVAGEVGIDRDSLLQALESLDSPMVDSSFKWFSGTSKIQDVSYIDGEVNLDNWDDIVQEIRKVNGGIGKTTQKGSSFEWEQRMSEIGYKHFSFTPKDGKTKVQFVSGWSGLKLLTMVLPTFFAFVFALIILKGIGLPKSTASLYAPIASIFGFGLGRFYLKSYFEKQKILLSSIQKSLNNLIRKADSSNPTISIENGAYDSEENPSTPNPKARTT